MLNRIVRAALVAVLAEALTGPASAQQPAQPGTPPQNVTLAQAIAIAAARSPVLSVARDDYRLAQVNVRIASTPLNPDVSGDAAETNSDTGGYGRTRGSSFGLQIQQLIYDGGMVLAQIRAARAGNDAAFGTYQRAAQTLSYNVAQAFYLSLEARATVVLDRQILKENREQEDLIRANIKAGTASRVDLETAHVPTVQSQLALTLAEHQAVAQQAAFDTTLGLHADAGVAPIDDSTVDPMRSRIPNEPLDYSKAIARARLMRPDYIASQSTVAAAQENLRAARLGHAPVLSASAAAGASSTLTSSTGFTVATPLTGNNSIGLSLNVPIYNQGLTNLQVSQNAVLLHQAQANSSRTELTVESDVSQGLATLEGAQDALRVAEAQLTLAKQVLSDTQEQYRGGYTVLSLLLNAQTYVVSAEDQRLAAIYALRQAEQSYLLALGDI